MISFHLPELIHNIAGSHGLKAVFLYGFPVLFRIHSSALVGSAALDDGSVQGMNQIPDQFRMQVMVLVSK